MKLALSPFLSSPLLQVVHLSGFSAHPAEPGLSSIPAGCASTGQALGGSVTEVKDEMRREKRSSSDGV